MKHYLALILALLLTLALVGCGTMASDSNTMSSESYYGTVMDGAGFDYGYSEDSAELPAETTASSLAERGVKMVYTANIEAQTLSYEQATADIVTLVESFGGYFEQKDFSNYSSSYRSASYTIRVPAERFSEFCTQVGTLCHVTWSSDSAENISEQYYDTQSRLETAQIKLERLQELLKKAENMEDIITIESAISETEQLIESLSGTMRRYDSLVDYATVYLSLNEVYRLSGTEEAPKTFGEKLANAFSEGLDATGEALEDFAIWLAYSWLGILIFLACAFVAVKVLARVLHGKKLPSLRRKKKAADAAEKNTEE